MSSDDIGDTTLNAYVDGQLDPELQRAVLEAIRHDSRVRERVCQLRMAKHWMRTGFPVSPATPYRCTRGSSGWRSTGRALAASLAMLAVGVGAGMLGYFCADADRLARGIEERNDRVVLHLDDSDPDHFRAVLDYAEQFLRDHRARGARVEVVANSAGIDLMRRGVSPYEPRIEAMLGQYANLHFIACANSLRQLRKRGEETRLITDVHSGTTAVDHIVARLHDGWSYRKMEDLGGI